MNKLEIIAMILSLVGNVFIIYKSKIGFAIWVIANTLWVIFALNRKDKHYWMALLFILYIILAIIGWFRW